MQFLLDTCAIFRYAQGSDELPTSIRNYNLFASKDLGSPPRLSIFKILESRMILFPILYIRN